MPNFAAVSTPLFGAAANFGYEIQGRYGQIPEWPNGADCKSAGLRLRWFESIFAHYQQTRNAEIAQLVEH